MKEKSERPNPYFRGYEKDYDGGPQEIQSPVASCFSHGYLHEGPNAMETALKNQLHGRSSKDVSKGAK